MQHKWMVFFSALVLLSSLLAPAGTAQAQEGSLDCPPYEAAMRSDRDFLRSLPPECIEVYQEFSRPAANAREGQPTAAGGPDEFGYTYDDTVPYNWISATTDSGLTGYNEFTGPIDIGFSFPFYGIPQTQLYFSTNGSITFGAGNGEQPGTLPSEAVPNNLIAPFWDWLYYVGSPYNNAAIYYAQGGTAPNRYFVVEWRDVELDYSSSPGPFTFEAILYESGDILFQYQSLPGYQYFGPRIGIENSIGSDGLAYSDYRYWYSVAPRAVRFSYPTTSTARLLVSPAVRDGAFASIDGDTDFPITVTNPGTAGADTYDLTPASAWPLSLYKADGVTQLTDTDGDSLVDTGSLPQGQSISLIARVSTPNGAQVGDENKAAVTITSSLNTSQTRAIDLFTSIPAEFANVFQDEADGAMSFMTVDATGISTSKATADDHFGYEMAVSKMPNDNYVYVWNMGYNNGDYWVDNIEYAILGPTGNLILPATKLTNNDGAPIYTGDQFPAAAVAPDGTIGVVWRRYLSDDATDTYNYNIYFATLDSAGSLLTGPTNITNKPLVDVQAIRMESPTIAATDDNRFVISWPESLPPISPYYRDYIWYAVRDTDGANVFSPYQLTGDYVSSQFPVLNPLTDGKVILTWVDYSNAIPEYAIINSDGSIAALPWLEDLGTTVSQTDAVQLPNGKVAIAWAAYGGVQFAILNPYYLVESISSGASTLTTWGNDVSVTTDADGHVIMTLGMQSDPNHLYYALGDSTGAFITDLMPYKTSSNYINISGNGQGNAPYSAEPDTTAPTVTSIRRVSAATTSAGRVSFTVTFSEPVRGVASGDFSLSTTGDITGANIHQVTGSSSVYTVVVNTGSGNGTLGLTVPIGATIQDLAWNPIGGLPFTGGETYTIVETSATWQYVGPAGFSSGGANYPSLALHGNTPYMAFGDGANGGKASVMKFDGSSWVNVGPAGFSDGWAFYTSLAIGNGTPYVAFMDMAHEEKLSVMKFNGTSWVNVGPAGFSNSRIQSISIAVDNGTPYVVFNDEAPGISVMKFNGTDWVNVGAEGIPQGSGDTLSLVFNNGTPYVAFSHWSNGGKPSVMKFDGTGWVNVGPANFSPGQANGVSLAFEGSMPYVAFADGDKGWQASVMKFDGANWVNVGTAGFSGGEATWISLAIDNGMPYVAFGDGSNGSKASVMAFDGTGWANVGSAGFSPGGTDYTSLAVKNGTPYVGFADGANDWKPSVMKFADSEVDSAAPVVASISRAGTSHTNAASVNFIVTFSEPVLNVNTNDFALSTSGSITGAAITNVTGSGSARTVTVNTGSGNGLLSLRLPVGASITDAAGNSLAGLPFTTGESYTILKVATFSDVEKEFWAWQYVERLVNAGITAGCGEGQYCPNGTVTRAQMAVFLLKGIHGSSYSPPAVGGSTGFGDVETTHWAAKWIKQLAVEKITGGCENGNYCPDSAVTRAQMAIFLLKAKYGASYSPPAIGSGTGFGDVDTDHWAAKWIKQLAAEGITGGCGNGNYCPDTPVTRAQMAVFLVKTFSLP